MLLPLSFFEKKESHFDENILITHVTTDSRGCKKGSLFIALKGKKVSGEDFLQEAFDNGAVAAIVSISCTKNVEGLYLIKVADPLKELQMAAKTALTRKKPLVIGITGSVGKTTVKDFLGELISGHYHVHKTEGSQNGQIGLALTILNAPDSADVFVLEMGISFPGEMTKLIEIAPSDIAIVTKVAPAHVGHFKNLEDIAGEKALLLQQEGSKKRFSHPLNKRFDVFSKLSEILFFYRVDEKLENAPFTESHLLENLCAAVCVARYLGISEDMILEKVDKLKPASHRYQKWSFPHLKDILIIDDTYNSSPVALKTSLQSLQVYKNKRRVIAVIGEMKELGAFSKLAHEELALIARFTADIVFCFGEEARALHEVFIRFEKPSFFFSDKEKLKAAILEKMERGDVLFFKGSRSSKLEECIDFLSKEQNLVKNFCLL